MLWIACTRYLFAFNVWHNDIMYVMFKKIMAIGNRLFAHIVLHTHVDQLAPSLVPENGPQWKYCCFELLTKARMPTTTFELYVAMHWVWIEIARAALRSIRISEYPCHNSVVKQASSLPQSLEDMQSFTLQEAWRCRKNVCWKRKNRRLPTLELANKKCILHTSTVSPYLCGRLDAHPQAFAEGLLRILPRLVNA